MDSLKANSRILEIRQIADRTTELSFKRPSRYNFQAGQYSQIIIPKLLYDDKRGPSRLFSIASSPLYKERITIAFRDSESGYKRTLLGAPLGYEVVIRGPFGRDFNLPQDNSRKVVFIAGGIGITPFLSMSRFAAEKGLSLPITLLYANKSAKRSAYLKEIEEIARLNPNFRVKNKQGLVDKGFIKNNVKDILASDWYIAGLPAMVEEARSILSSLGVDPYRIHTERFTGY